MVGQKCGNVGEASAVSCINYEDKCKYKENKKPVALSVLNTAGDHYKCGKCDGKDEDHLIDGISVLHGICPCGESETSTGIEYS